MLSLLPRSRVEAVCLATFLASTPVAVYAVFALGGDREWWALANSYSFSTAYVVLLVWPLVCGRLDAAVANWVVWLTCFTQIVFQIPHNALVRTLHSRRGSLLEWPFFAYGVSDARWSTYTDRFWGVRAAAADDVGLPPEVWLINWNDGFLGLVVLLALLAARRAPPASAPRLFFLLALLFRDATLFRENLEYMLLQHHMPGYPHTTSDPARRPHALACLWLVNGPWFVGPPLTFVWAWRELSAGLNGAGAGATTSTPATIKRATRSRASKQH